MRGASGLGGELRCASQEYKTSGTDYVITDGVIVHILSEPMFGVRGSEVERLRYTKSSGYT